MEKQTKLLVHQDKVMIAKSILEGKREELKEKESAVMHLVQELKKEVEQGTLSLALTLYFLSLSLLLSLLDLLKVLMCIWKQRQQDSSRHLMKLED